MRFTSSFLATKRIPWLQVVKTFIAIAISWVVSMLVLRVDMPIFAAIAALLIVAPNLGQTVSKAIERTLGVIAGVIIASVFGGIFGHNAIAALTAIAVALLIGWAGTAPARAAGPTGAAVELPAADGKRDGSGVTPAGQLAAVAGAFPA